VFKSLQRFKWKTAVGREFLRCYGVDLRSVGEIIGSTTLRRLLDDEYELAPNNPALGVRNVTEMLAHVHRVKIAPLAPREPAAMMPVRGHAGETARPAVGDAWSARGGRDAIGERAVATARRRS
jgi:hypothetical protein